MSLEKLKGRKWERLVSSEIEVLNNFLGQEGTSGVEDNAVSGELSDLLYWKEIDIDVPLNREPSWLLHRLSVLKKMGLLTRIQLKLNQLSNIESSPDLWTRSSAAIGETRQLKYLRVEFIWIHADHEQLFSSLPNQLTDLRITYSRQLLSDVLPPPSLVAFDKIIQNVSACTSLTSLSLDLRSSLWQSQDNVDFKVLSRRLVHLSKLALNVTGVANQEQAKSIGEAVGQMKSLKIFTLVEEDGDKVAKAEKTTIEAIAKGLIGSKSIEEVTILFGCEDTTSSSAVSHKEATSSERIGKTTLVSLNKMVKLRSLSLHLNDKVKHSEKTKKILQKLELFSENGTLTTLKVVFEKYFNPTMLIPIGTITSLRVLMVYFKRQQREIRDSHVLPAIKSLCNLEFLAFPGIVAKPRHYLRKLPKLVKIAKARHDKFFEDNIYFEETM